MEKWKLGDLHRTLHLLKAEVLDGWAQDLEVVTKADHYLS